MLTKTQKGAIGELMLSACVMLASDGDLELFRPVTDDDHTDVTAGERGKVPALAIQVKTALKLNRQGYAVAKMEFPSAEPREHPAFVYAIAYVVDGSIDAAWIVPSADFNRHAYRGKGRRGKGIELVFMGSPTREDQWSAFRSQRMDLGRKFVSLIDSLPATTAPSVPGAHLLLRRAGRIE